MLKTLITSILILSFLILPFSVSAQMMGLTTNTETGKHQLENLADVMETILGREKLDSIQNLDCKQLSESDLEQIGDALMEEIHPGETHERMDTMMGGEGSESLRQIHIRMGSNYLGCNTQTKQNGYGMMGFGMGGMMGGTGVWGGINNVSNSFAWLYQGFILINMLLIVIFLSLGIKYFWQKGGDRK